MDIGLIIHAAEVSLVIVLVILFGGAAIYYAIVKRKDRRDYESRGIPRMTDSTGKKEGSTERKQQYK